MQSRVYKYGLIPIGHLQQGAIDELFRANALWNTLVALHREHIKEWDNARRLVSQDYAKQLDILDTVQNHIDQAYQALRQALIEEGTKDETNPRLKAVRTNIKQLEMQRSELYTTLKPLRKTADKDVDKKQLMDAYRQKCNSAVAVKNSGISRHTADRIFENFKTARDKAFKDTAKLRFHRFDGTGFFHFRCREKGLKTDGISVGDFMNARFEAYNRFCVKSFDHRHKKPRIRVSAILSGRAGQSGSAIQEFDMIYHRPYPRVHKFNMAKSYAHVQVINLNMILC